MAFFLYLCKILYAYTHAYMRMKLRKVLRYRLVTHDIKHISLMPFLLLNHPWEACGDEND